MLVTVEVSISEDLLTETPEIGAEDVPEPALLEAWANAAYLSETPAVVSMMISTSAEIQQLNKQYRDKDKATNVLSFPMELPEEVDMHFLGDLALCASVIRQEAKEQSKTELFHWAHMVVHGMLHLQGFDHMEDDEAEEMEALEVNILKSLDFDDPYK